MLTVRRSEAPINGTRSITRSRALTEAEMATSVAGDSIKRKHQSDVEDAPTDVLAKRQKSLELMPIYLAYWYDDGNVIIQIDDTPFKLYCGQLSSHSTYFTELFQEPPPQRDIDGGPLYVVSGTNVVDFVALLNAMKDMVWVISTPLSWF